jgi:dTDP-glucose 4,6-dehydratase
MSKWINEQQFRNSMRLHDTETMILRFFNAYGPGERYHSYRSVVCLFAYHALRGWPYTVFEGYHRVFMYVDDLIDTLARCPDRFKAGEVYNIGGREYKNVRELSDRILKLVDRDDSNVEYLPRELANVTNKRPDISKAERDLDHDPGITLNKGLPLTVAWMREEYGL